MTKNSSRRFGRVITRISILGAAAATAVAGNVAFGVNYTWTRAAGNNNWDSTTGGGTTSNWATDGSIATPPPQVPAVGQTTDIIYSGMLTIGNTTSSLRQDYTVDSITFASDFWHGNINTFSLSSATLLTGATSAHLTVGAGGITSQVGNGVGTFNINITRNVNFPGDLILGADQTWNTNAPAASTGAITFTLTRALVGDKKLTKSGTGVLVIASANNTGFTGTLELQQGSIRTGGAATDPNSHFGSAVLVANNPEDFTITSSNVNSLGGARNFDNDLILAGGAGALVFGGSFPLNFTANSTWTLEQDKEIGASVSTTHSGNITGNFGWTKENGGMIILNGANDYSGVTTVSDGVLQPKTATALGTTAGGTVVQSGGALELTGQSIVGETLSIAGTGEGSTNNNNADIEPNAGALRSRVGSNVWTGPVTLTSENTYVAVDQGTSLGLPAGVSGDGTASLRVGGAGASPGMLQTAFVRAGGLALDSGANVAFTADGTAAGRSNLGSLSIAGGATPAAQLDLTNNAMVIDSTTEAAVRDLIIAGRAGGSWNGNGIASSAAAANASAGVGYAIAADVPASPIFGTVDPTDVLLRYTLNGDADLSGTVDIGDFALLAANFNQGGGWSKGDSNYDGQVDIGDFAQLAANFNQSAGDLPRAAAVPEPAAALVGFLFGGAMIRRRRPSYE